MCIIFFVSLVNVQIFQFAAKNCCLTRMRRRRRRRRWNPAPYFLIRELICYYY
jgi:hypothetical protein